MEFDSVVENRKSTRRFSEKQVDKELIVKLLESARLAPSAVNFQPWKFYVCTSEGIKLALRESYDRKWFAEAQTYIVACGDHSQSWKRPTDGKDHCDMDVAIAVEHIVLKATDLGLGICWVCHFDVGKVKKALQLSDSWEPMVILPVGYPANDFVADGRNKKRKALDEIVEWK